jgi:hypothetical protein
MNARAVSGEHLEVLGKHAAARWAAGREKTLGNAVVSTVKTAGLSPEQVKRVVEFANTAAYLTDFKKEGSLHRVVDFGAGGLADPSAVIQDLNDGGGGSSYDTGSLEYNHPPPQTKTASAWDEASFEQMFASSGQEYPEVNPLGDVLTLRDKLASSYETSTSMLSSLEVMYEDLSTHIFNQVKQAALSGHALSEIAQIWQQCAPSDEHVKVAFQVVMDPLVDNGVFQNHAAVAQSLSKHSSVGLVNPDHPLVTHFKDFCDVLSKMAEAREEQQQYGEGVARLTSFLKEAATGKGLIHHGEDALQWASGKAQRGGEAVGRSLLGKDHEWVKHFGTAGKAAPYAAALVGANEIRRKPAVQRTIHGIASKVPGTEDYRQREMELAARDMGYGGG